MKHLFSFFLLAALVSCAPEKLDEAAAQKTAESALDAMKTESFDELYSYYTKDFSESEPVEVRTEKFAKIFGATGKVVSYELVDTKQNLEVGEVATVVLTYKVKHERLSTQIQIALVKEEGKLLISSLGIQNL